MKNYKKIFEKWWDNDGKCFQILNYREPWKENGNKPRITLYENGGRKRNGDRCFDITLIIGYTIFNYCNFNLQGTQETMDSAITVKENG